VEQCLRPVVSGVAPETFGGYAAFVIILHSTPFEAA